MIFKFTYRSYFKFSLVFIGVLLVFAFTSYRNSRKTILLLFEPNQTESSPEHLAALERNYHTITISKKRYIDSVVVKGHASKEGKVEENLKLSQERAMNTKKLIQQVDSTLLIKTYYFGASIPNPDYKEKNKGEYDRRAEVIFYFRNR